MFESKISLLDNERNGAVILNPATKIKYRINLKLMPELKR